MILRVGRGCPAWASYDANSAFSAIVQVTVFPAYYAGIVVGNDAGRGDLLWGLVVSVAIAALASPILGGAADYSGARKHLLTQAFTIVANHSLYRLDRTTRYGRARRGDLGLPSESSRPGRMGVGVCLLQLLSAPHRSSAGFWPRFQRRECVGFAGGIISFAAAALPFARC